MFRPATSNRLGMINLATGGPRGFTYDASGSVTAEARPGGTYGYTYNAAGRMSEFRINGILQASYRYDAMGRQAIRTLSSPTAVTIHSVFDSEGRRIAEYKETSGALIREYVWNGWEPVAVIEGGVISFVRADHIGRPVFATNSTGVKTWTATYTPFGGVHTSTGAPPTARFPGQWFQSESGLHQNWMRDYDPTTGRYLQANPLGLIDGASVYGYAGQSPMMNMDPTGQCFGPWAIACAAAAGGAISVYIGWLLDPDCYTWQEGLRDFTIGFTFGGFGQAWNAAGKAGAWGAGAWSNSWKAGTSKAAEEALQNHHAWPMYLGGPSKQTLVPMSTPLHQAFHSGLDKILPRQWGKAFYDGLGDNARRQMMQDLAAYTRAFDQKYGTRLHDALIKNGFPDP